MKTIKIVSLSALILAFFAFTQISKRTIKSSSVSFVIKNFGLGVDGTFKNMRVKEFKFDNDSLSKCKIDITIDAKTVNTGIDKRDEHLRKPDYFDATKYPTIRMKSKRFGRSKAGNVIGYFYLTMKGVTKEVKMPIYVKKTSKGTQFKTGAFSINRLDFKVGGSTMSLADNAKVTVLINTN